MRDATPGEGAPGAGRRVTVAGEGIAAIEAILALRALAPALEIDLLAPRSAFEHNPLSILEPFGIEPTPAFDLAGLADEHEVTVRRGTLSAIDPDAHTLATGRGTRCPYDLLLVATGAHAVDGVPGATTFRGRRDRVRVVRLLEECARGAVRRLALAVPGGVIWTLPVYELALLTATEVGVRHGRELEIEVVTPEAAPLELFGPRASSSIAELLDDARVRLRTSAHPERFEDGLLLTRLRRTVPFDRVVALPRLRGPALPGLPSDQEGFVPTDRLGRVEGVEDVYAAGDATTFPIRQDGVACQQADAAATAIAAAVGADGEPEPFEPVLRGVLMTGITARYLELGPARGHSRGTDSRLTLWEPASKVFGRYLPPYLRDRSPPARASPSTGGLSQARPEADARAASA